MIPRARTAASSQRDLYRVRVGPARRYRVIYLVEDVRLVVTVVKVAIRDESSY